jgi:hypothetical protein
LGAIAVEGGSLYFIDPNNNPQRFSYGAVGAGFSEKLKFGKVGRQLVIPVRGSSVSGAVAPTSFRNAGVLLMTERVSSDELSRNDIQGLCGFIELSAGAGLGGSAYAMLLGMNPCYLPLATTVPNLLMGSAAAILFMGGMSIDIQAGGGITAFGGYLR